MPTDQDQNNSGAGEDQTLENQNNENDESQDTSLGDDIADLLGHFADEHAGDDGTKKPEGEQKPSGKPEDEAKPDGGKEGTAQSQTPKPGEEQKPAVEAKPEPSLKDVLKEVLAENKADQKPAETKPEEKPEGPKYSPMIPTELMAAIESDDPKVRQQGISAALGGAMNRVYADLKKEIDAKVATVMQSLPTIISQREAAQVEAKKTHDTFYSENPNFGSSPARKRLVAQTALLLAQQLGTEYKGFTPEFQEKLATELETMTGIKKGKAPEAQKPADTKPAKKPGFQANNSGARSGGGEKSLADDIAETIGWAPGQAVN